MVGDFSATNNIFTDPLKGIGKEAWGFIAQEA